MPKNKIKSSAKFVVKEEGVGFIIGQKGTFTKYMQDQLNVYLKCYRDKYNRALSADQSIVVLYLSVDCF